MDTERLFERLNRHAVKYILVGGMAAVAQGSSYLTADVDLCYARDEDNLERLAQALAPFHPTLRGAPPGLPFRLDIPTLRAGLNFTLSTDIGDLDLFGEIAGLGDYDRVIEFSQVLDIYDVPCHVLTLEGLILSKKTAGRSKDLRLLPELETLLEIRKSQSSE
jgi:predicted nucleotidyltransferase